MSAVKLTKTKSGYERKADGHRFTVVESKKMGGWVVKHWGPNVFNRPPATKQTVTDKGRVVVITTTLEEARDYIAGVEAVL